MKGARSAPEMESSLCVCVFESCQVVENHILVNSISGKTCIKADQLLKN